MVHVVPFDVVSLVSLTLRVLPTTSSEAVEGDMDKHMCSSPLLGRVGVELRFVRRYLWTKSAQQIMAVVGKRTETIVVDSPSDNSKYIHGGLNRF